MRERDLTFDEMATWGECPVCKAADGEWCCSEIGLQVGVKADGSTMKTGEGAHMARLKNAPLKVKLVPA